MASMQSSSIIFSLLFVSFFLTVAVVLGSSNGDESFRDGGVRKVLGLVNDFDSSSVSNAGGMSSGGDSSSSSSSVSFATSEGSGTGSDDVSWSSLSSAETESITSVESRREDEDVGEKQGQEIFEPVDIISSVESSKDDQEEGFGRTVVEDIMAEDDVVRLEELRKSIPQLYHSPRVLALNYNEMMEKLKVYVYPAQNESNKYELGFSTEEPVVEPRSTADFFFKNLAESEVVTEDPEEAQLFLLPVSIDGMLSDLSLDEIGGQLRRYVQQTREEYEFWNRSLGADHFFLSCHGYPPDGHRNFLELSKNAIQVACTPLRPTQGFFPHKDIVMPPYKPVQNEDSESSFEGIDKDQTLRTSLVFSNAQVDDHDRDPAVQSALEDWKADPDFDLESEALQLPQFYKKLGTSRFCLSFVPHETLDLVDFLRFGCVPVMISRSGFSTLPLQDVLNWHEFAIVLDVKEIGNLKDILADISDDKYQRMQYLGLQASKHMEWNTDPVAYDAFHMILYELWLRQYSVRYARVSPQ